VTIAPLSVAFIKVAIRTEGGAPPGEGNLCLANIASSQHPLVTGGPYLVTPDSLGQVTVAVKNCAPTELELARNDFIGTLFFVWFLKILLTQEHITKLYHIKNIYTITQKENIYNIKITRTYVNMYMLFYSIICCFYGMSF
jgi:hypothetical protein